MTDSCTIHPAKEPIFLNAPPTIQLTSLLGFALLANLPLGFLREGVRKFSLRWFVYIHISIPFIIALRQICGFGWEVVPLTVACAVAGQVAGGRIARGRR